MCIFCQIIANKIPSYKIYEDDTILAFLDINPLTYGHILLVPKKHTTNIFDIPLSDLKHLITVAQKISQKIKKLNHITGINLLHASGKSAQQSIFHFHIHLVPRSKDDGLNTWPQSRYHISPKELESIAVKIKKFI